MRSPPPPRTVEPPGEAAAERRDEPRKRRRVRSASKAPVRLSDVAKRAGVSSGTVSRVLNQRHLVTPATVAAVQAAIDALGWVPHGAARALASHRTRMIGAIIPTLANPNFASMIYAIQDRLMLDDYILMIGCSEYDPMKGLLEARTMVERGIEGLILLGENFPDALWTLLEAQRVPHLIAFGFRHDGGRHFVGFDNARAAALATEHLLELGHRRFAVFAQQVLNNDRAEARLRGIVDALTAARIRLEPDRIIQKPWSIREGHGALRQLMALGPMPSAIICSNDYLAAGALAACRAHGLRVPEDISIVGFDDLEIAAYLNPPLTTIHVPAAAIGAKAADLLIDRIAKGAPLASVEFAPELVIRGSTAPPARKAP